MEIFPNNFGSELALRRKRKRTRAVNLLPCSAVLWWAMIVSSGLWSCGKVYANSSLLAVTLITDRHGLCLRAVALRKGVCQAFSSKLIQESQLFCILLWRLPSRGDMEKEIQYFRRLNLEFWKTTSFKTDRRTLVRALRTNLVYAPAFLVWLNCTNSWTYRVQLLSKKLRQHTDCLQRSCIQMSTKEARARLLDSGILLVHMRYWVMWNHGVTTTEVLELPK